MANLECHFVGPCTSVASDAEGNVDSVTTLEYDADGQLISETVRYDGEAATVTTYGYDDQNRLILCKNDQCDGDGWCVWLEYEYDEHGNLTTMLDYSMYSGRVNTCEHHYYDELGQRIRSEIDSGCTGTTTSVALREYDGKGQLVVSTIEDPAGGYQILYDYDPLERLSAEVTIRDGVTESRITHEYNDAGYEIQETYESDHVTSYEIWTYDASGNPLSREEHMAVDGTDESVQTWIWSYDGRGNLIDERQESANGSRSQCKTWTFDDCGNLISEGYAYACDDAPTTTVHDYTCFL